MYSSCVSVAMGVTLSYCYKRIVSAIQLSFAIQYSRDRTTVPLGHDTIITMSDSLVYSTV